MRKIFLLPVIAATFTLSAHAEDTPFIDTIKSQLPPPDESGSYTERIRSEIGTEPPLGEGPSASPYIDQIRSTDSATSGPEPSQGYTDREKERLGPPLDGGAIAAVSEGRSELHPRYEGAVTTTFGMRYGLALSRNITGPATAVANNFNSVYGQNPSAELQIYVERQLLRLEGGGSLGVTGSVGIGYFSGMGVFGANLRKPWDPTQTFGLASNTFFQFWEFPVMLGASGRISLMKYLQPYAIVGPAAIGYLETRNDPVSGGRGVSTGIQATAGVAVLMDWISPSDKWDAYAGSGIKHGYLTVEYTLLQPLTGDISFNVNGLSAGFALEF